MTNYEPGQPLSVQEVDLIRHIVAVLGPDRAEPLVSQAKAASIIRGSATMIDVEIPDHMPRVILPNGPIPVRAFVGEPDAEPTGEILIWVRDGALIGMEQAWWTDDPPPTWPSPDRVLFG